MNYGEMRQAYDWEVRHRETLLDAQGRGFMTYEFHPDAVWISEVYVAPEYRRTGAAREMLARVEEMARQFDRTRILGSVDATTKTWRASVAAQEACGFVLINEKDGIAWLEKRIPPRDPTVTHELVPAVVNPAVEE